MDAHELNQVATLRGTGQSEAASRWIQSPRFDLAFFILSPLVALPILITAPAGPSMLALAAGSLLGVPHYLSTFVFFFWDETRAQHRAERALFFGVPVLIVATLGFAAVFRVPFIIQLVVYTWNTFHVSRQSCGILSIYRHRAGVTDPAVRSVVNGAVVWTAFALAFWNISGHPTLYRFMTILSPQLPQAVRLVAGTAAVVAMARLAVSLVQRFQSEKPPQLPELVFLATSLLLFHPYLWIRDSNRATLGMLVGHFIQYLGIVWLIHRRKFRQVSGAVSQPWLAKLSTSLPLLLVAILTSGGFFMGLYFLSERARVFQAMYEGIYLSLALVHFYLDGLFWAFRRPEVRQSLGPFLFGRRPERTAS